MSATQIAQVRNWMESLSDFMIQHPHASARDASLHFGKSEAWISIVKNSDAFRQYHASRRDEHFCRISQGVINKVEALAEISIDQLTEKVEEKGLSAKDLTDVGKLALTALGFGGNRGAQVQINTQGGGVVVADQEALAKARDRMRELRGSNDKVIEHEQSETPIALPAGGARAMGGAA